MVKVEIELTGAEAYRLVGAQGEWTAELWSQEGRWLDVDAHPVDVLPTAGTAFWFDSFAELLIYRAAKQAAGFTVVTLLDEFYSLPYVLVVS
jgi:hypothetical protein